MTLWAKKTVVIMGLIVAALLSIGATMQPLQGLRVPVDYYPDGTLKHELLAQEARALEDGTLEAKGVEFRLFTEEGVQEVLIRAEDAIVNRAQLQGHSDRAVSLERDRLLLTGDGFEWNGAGETIRILRNVRLSFPSQMFREGEDDRGDQNE